MGSKNPKIKPRHKKTQETKAVTMGQTEKKETKAQRVLETRQPTDIDTDKDRN
jgi:hypothetical protein